MKRAQKEQAENFIKLLEQAHEKIRALAEKQDRKNAMLLLEDCQEGAIALGTSIEQSEGEGFPTVALLENYCELTYQIHEQLAGGDDAGANKIHKALKRQLVKIANSIANDIPVRRAMAFLPYKASMWDSLESIWMAAEADPACDAYVIPIPYYDRKPDGSFGTCHYEADLMPPYVQTTEWEEFASGEIFFDAIFIHNPYDNCNYVTSVHPFFYSENLKKYTNTLVYVPYYATTGGMSEGQAMCPAYIHADYLVIQAEKYKGFFDSSISESKFLAFGSPKFDKTIRLCQDPLEPPKEWKEKLDGRKVYFYNTSIGGMLGDTGAFLKKMEYVFSCFQGRTAACLLWRPHPLLESTFDSMRGQYRPAYDALKKRFIESGIGIYDTTPDIEKTIAVSDSYIGDSGTSVTSLFGVAGKPMFILDNQIHSLPTEKDIAKAFIRGFFIDGQDEWQVTVSNKLYYAPEHDYHYQYFCDLAEDATGGYYLRAVEADGKLFICPANAQDIKVIDLKDADKKIRTIPLKKYVEQPGAFCGAYVTEDNLFLVPFHYPYLIRFHISSEKLDYVEYDRDLFAVEDGGQWKIGGSCVCGEYLLLASPVDNRVEAIHMKSLRRQKYKVGKDASLGCLGMRAVGDDIILLPYDGMKVRRWNMRTGRCETYDNMPDGLQCTNRIHGYSCMERPFGGPEVKDGYMILPPYWGNMFVKVDLKTGVCAEWEPPFEVRYEENDGYLRAGSVGGFIRSGTYYDAVNRNVIEIDTDTGEYVCHDVAFDGDDVLRQEGGFRRQSQWFQYGCSENAVNSLPDYLDGKLKGPAFDKEKQIRAFAEINAAEDGNCGGRVYEFVKNRE